MTYFCLHNFLLTCGDKTLKVFLPPRTTLLSLQSHYWEISVIAGNIILCGYQPHSQGLSLKRDPGNNLHLNVSKVVEETLLESWLNLNFESKLRLFFKCKTHEN